MQKRKVTLPMADFMNTVVTLHNNLDVGVFFGRPSALLRRERIHF